MTAPETGPAGAVRAAIAAARQGNDASRWPGKLSVATYWQRLRQAAPISKSLCMTPLPPQKASVGQVTFLSMSAASCSRSMLAAAR